MIFLEKKSLNGFKVFKSRDGSICFTFETDPELKLSLRLMRMLASTGLSEQKAVINQLGTIERPVLSRTKPERRCQAFLGFAIETLEDIEQSL